MMAARPEASSASAGACRVLAGQGLPTRVRAGKRAERPFLGETGVTAARKAGVERAATYIQHSMRRCRFRLPPLQRDCPGSPGHPARGKRGHPACRHCAPDLSWHNASMLNAAMWPIFRAWTPPPSTPSSAPARRFAPATARPAPCFSRTAAKCSSRRSATAGITPRKCGRCRS